jgi:hypothetical protein
MYFFNLLLSFPWVQMFSSALRFQTPSTFVLWETKFYQWLNLFNWSILYSRSIVTPIVSTVGSSTPELWYRVQLHYGSYTPSKTIGKHSFATKHPTDQPAQNIMSCGWNLRWFLIFLLNWRWRQRNRGHFLKETTYEDNLLADLKVKDEAGFRNFVRMTSTDFDVVLQMTDCKISSFNVFLRVHILGTCLGSSSR